MRALLTISRGTFFSYVYLFKNQESIDEDFVLFASVSIIWNGLSCMRMWLNRYSIGVRICASPCKQVCYACGKSRGARLWRCQNCSLATHENCIPCPEGTTLFHNRPGWAICWRHASDVDYKVCQLRSYVFICAAHSNVSILDFLETSLQHIPQLKWQQSN